MIEALLHGKLTPKQENMEDILTSNVFGMLQYVDPQQGLFRFLAKARTIDGDYPLKNINGCNNLEKPEFWPRWQNCEPDVVLFIKKSVGSPHLICIEAKYRSGKSSVAEYIEEYNEEQLAQECTDQLIREWNNLVKEAKIRRAEPILIYLTADVGCPRQEILDSIDEYNKKQYSNSTKPLICWLSWRELSGLFRDDSNQILKAIASMAEKMELIFFHKITHLTPISVKWNFKGPPNTCKKWPFHFSPVICIWRFNEPIVTWHFKVAPIISHWRFKQWAKRARI